MHVMPVHLSVAPGYSLSPALHTQPSAVVAGAIKPSHPQGAPAGTARLQ